MAHDELTAGQFAFAPATQQTTVITTTTTTISLPPFVLDETSIRPKDGGHYPLAHVPTPADLRAFTFNLGGQQATFLEAEHAQPYLTEVI